jgi:hypothetical protein
MGLLKYDERQDFAAAARYLQLEFWPEVVPRCASFQSSLLRSSEASLSFLAK